MSLGLDSRVRRGGFLIQMNAVAGQVVLALGGASAPACVWLAWAVTHCAGKRRDERSPLVPLVRPLHMPAVGMQARLSGCIGGAVMRWVDSAK